MKARAMVQIAARRLEMEEFEIPKVGETEGLLRVEACGLCGSDVEQYRGHFAEKGLAEYRSFRGTNRLASSKSSAQLPKNAGASRRATASPCSR